MSIHRKKARLKISQQERTDVKLKVKSYKYQPAGSINEDLNIIKNKVKKIIKSQKYLQQKLYKDYW